MGHVFISYSHTDSDYAHGLAKNLQLTGFDVWIDERLDYGSQWPQEIQKQLDACDAFILIMTSRSFASDWVQSELQWAKRKRKPIFPLLLEGNEPWLSVEATQFYDVRGGIYPDSRFYSALKRTASNGQSVPKLQVLKKPVQTKPTTAQKSRISTETIVAVIGAGATICAALLSNISLIKEWLVPQNPEITVIPLSTFSVGIDAPLLPATTVVTELNSTALPTLTATVVVFPTETLTPTLTPTNTLTETASPTNTIAPTVILVSNTDAPEAEMVLVPAGQFTMGFGSDPNIAGPEHNPDLDAFFIDKYEVTNAFYKICVVANGCSMPSNHTTYNNPDYGDHPVVFVNWKQARTYCEWRGARLPTEAEWEKAARGTDGRTYPWGEGIGCNLANASGCKDGTSKVGSYQDVASAYGAYDLAGNVSEWVSSLYKPYPYSAFDGREDLNSDGLRVLRGGNWNLNFTFLRAWYRNPADPEIPLDRVGFRCAKDAP